MSECPGFVHAHTVDVMFCSCSHNMSVWNFSCGVNMSCTVKLPQQIEIFHLCVKTILHSLLPLGSPLLFHGSIFSFSPSPPLCALLFPPFPTLITSIASSCCVLFSSFASCSPLFPPSSSVLLQSFLPAACQLPTLTLIVSRHRSQGGIYRNQRCPDVADLFNATIHRGHWVAMPKSI